MFYVTLNEYTRQTRRIRELTATVTDLLLRQGRLLDRIYELTYQVNEADLRAEAAEVRVRELEAAIANIHALATECPQPSEENGYVAGIAVQEWVNDIHAIAEFALEDSND